MSSQARSSFSQNIDSTQFHLGAGSSLPNLPNNDKPRLYSMRFCPYSQRVHLVLDAKGIPYYTIYINLTEKPEWLTEKSPLGKVPALEIPTEKGNPTIFESLIICEYLDEKYPEKPLFSKDPLQKALDKILIHRFRIVTSSLSKIFVNGIEENPDVFENVTLGLDIYENELQCRGSKYFSGDNPGMLDFMIWPWFERCDMIPFLTVNSQHILDEKQFPKLIKWQSRMKNDNAVGCSFISGYNHARFIETQRTGNPNYDILM